MRIYNTLTGEKGEFSPFEGKKVRMYVCGITPYDKSHLGHARTLIAFDTIRRYLLHRGYEVIFVQNITDIDDKIIRRAAERRMLPLELAEKYASESAREFEALGVMKPDFEPKVSGFIPQIVELIRRVERNGCAYVTETGVYFEVAKARGYGGLSGQDAGELKAGARIEVDEKKRDPRDFALWKFGSDVGATFDSPWGRGRPGWHIECSAMAITLLGETIDIHGGAMDLVFPHHENEIAQSEAATGKPFARFFMHTGFLTVNGEKMAKSLGNFITVEDGLRRFKPQSLRMLFSLSHYKSPIDFSEASVAAAEKSLETLHSAISASESYSSKAQAPTGLAKEAKAAGREFHARMDDDFDLPGALVPLFALAKKISGACSEGKAAAEEAKEAGAELRSLLSIVGLAPVGKDGGVEGKLAAICERHGVLAGEGADESVGALIEIRNEARARKDFALSDAIRRELEDAGVALEDRRDGTTGWRRK